MSIADLALFFCCIAGCRRHQSAAQQQQVEIGVLAACCTAQLQYWVLTASTCLDASASRSPLHGWQLSHHLHGICTNAEQTNSMIPSTVKLLDLQMPGYYSGCLVQASLSFMTQSLESTLADSGRLSNCLVCCPMATPLTQVVVVKPFLREMTLVPSKISMRNFFLHACS